MNVLPLKHFKSISSYSVAFLVLMISQASNAEVQNSNEELVTNVLHSAEKSLPLVENNTTAALQFVEEALESVDTLKDNVSKNTHKASKSPLVLNDSKEYWFLYPQVDKAILNNEIDFPILNSKYLSGVLYRGENGKNNNYAYFDHAFASASLLTAKDALKANEYERAKIALKWVFEAVYITPDFLISTNEHNLQNNKLKIDSLINIKGDFPTFTKSREVSNISG